MQKIQFKVGQKIYCKHRKEHGIIYKIVEGILTRHTYPILVLFHGKDYVISYTEDGRYTKLSEPSLIIPIRIKINKLLNIC